MRVQRLFDDRKFASLVGKRSHALPFARAIKRRRRPPHISRKKRVVETLRASPSPRLTPSRRVSVFCACGKNKRGVSERYGVLLAIDSESRRYRNATRPRWPPVIAGGSFYCSAFIVALSARLRARGWNVSFSEQD